jgi:putative N6-adenine-specific DNA methylase
MTNTATHACYAKTFKGLEGPLAQELRLLGAKDVREDFRGVYFSGDDAMIYKANFTCRTALRILKKIMEFKVENEQELYEELGKFQWTDLFDVKQTFCIDAVTSASKMTHTQFVALKSKDAIVDQFRDKFNQRPNINTDNPTYRIHIHVHRNQCSVYLDASGTSLHIRSYKKHAGLAPLSEVMAAGLIQLAGWKGDQDLVDPMCGSGTILLEAAMAAMNYPAQFLRRQFAFMNWNDFDQDLWESIRRTAIDQKKDEIPISLSGFDIDPIVVRKCKENIISARMYGDIQVETADFFKLEPPAEPFTIITNPPYNERMRLEDSTAFYKAIGDRIKNYWKGSTVWLLLPDMPEARSIGLKSSARIPVMNGPIPCQFMCYKIF